MQDTSKYHLEKICASIVGDLGDDLLWQWDDRFETALTQFNIEEKNNIHSTLNRHLSVTWDSRCIQDAAEGIKNTASRMGGLKAGQMLLTSEADTIEFVYCAWWPWGNGEKISIRVAPSWLATSEDDQSLNVDLVKGWFGIATS